MDKKIFVGSGKKKSETWLKVTISEKGLQTLLNNLQEFNGNKFAKIDIKILQNPNQYGKDVECTLDTYKPKERTQQPEQQTSFSDTPF